MINSFFYIQKLKLLTPCYKFSSIPTATKSLLSLFAGEFFFSSQDRCRLFQSSLFSSWGGGGGGGGLLPPPPPPPPPPDALSAWSLRECAAGRGMVFVISVLSRVHNFMGVTLELICLMKFVCAPICKSNDYNVNFLNCNCQ